MSENIQVGPPDNQTIPKTSIGNSIFSALLKWDSDKISLVDGSNEEITYNKLFKCSVALAIRLQSLGIKKGDVVTIVARNCWKYLVTIISGFFVGATVNPLNPDYTYGELKHFFNICHPAIVFCTSDALDQILKTRNDGSFHGDIVVFDNETTPGVEHFDNLLENNTYNASFHPVDVKPSEVALIYTSSGTTGLPKCVQITHTNARLVLLYGHDPHFLDINETESILAFLPFFHILGNALCIVGIVFGAKLVILDRFQPDTFLESIQEQKITKLFSVPPILLFMVKNPLVQKYDISSIKDVLCGAAAVPKDVEELVQKQLNVESVRQVYGLTELTGAGTIIPKNVQKFGSAGQASISCQIKVCQPETGEILRIGETGELRIKSDGIMKGYLGDEAATLDVLDENGFLKTGDLGYCDSDGFFYIVGRLKEIIKYKGFQVSPAELENILVQHPAVKDAGVVGAPNERAGEVPVAFVVLQADKQVNEQELVDYVAANVSVQKRLYGGVRFVEQIPKNASGKIMRKKLKELL